MYIINDGPPAGGSETLHAMGGLSLIHIWITLIASTTENPFFAVFGAVLSRATVFEFKQLTAQDVLSLIHILL